MAARNNPRSLYISRVFDAPVKLVWEAWVDPKQVGQWWGPRGFTITTEKKEVRAGGEWRYVMHGPDGVSYPNVTKFHEVEKYSRLVYDHGGTDDKPPLFRVEVDFKEVKGPKGPQTRMEMSMTLPSPEAAAETKKFIKKAGGDSTWDRLAEYLHETSDKRDVFVINRSFEAPIDLLFKMWSDPKHIAQWLPPTGFAMEYQKADVRTGGTSQYFMSGSGPHGAFKLHGKASYLEITPPHRIVYTQSFCDEKGAMARHPLHATWPETMLTTVTFAEEGPSRTRVTVQWEVYGDAPAADRATFHQAKGGMSQGWTGSFDKLEEYLLKAR